MCEREREREREIVRERERKKRETLSIVAICHWKCICSEAQTDWLAELLTGKQNEVYPFF